jgi:glycosyltransferase involved in cell wall biosynthesis
VKSLSKRSERVRLLIVAPTLRIGGAERVVVEMLRHFDRQRFDLSLALLNREGEHLAGIPSTPVFDLGRRSRLSLGHLVWRMARLLRRLRPEVIVSHMWPANVVSLLGQACARSRAKVIVCEHSPPSLMFNTSFDPWGGLKRRVLRLAYPHAASVVAVSTGVKRDLCVAHGLSESKVCVIHDPIDLQNVRLQAASAPGSDCVTSQNRRTVLAVSRLTAEKDVATLMHAFALVRAKVPSQLLVVGDGPERSRLESLAHTLGLTDDVCFLGFDPNPYRYMARADVFVLSSRLEGFGIVLLEAMALGIPIVSTRCPSGPEEILLGGECGILVPVGDRQGLAAAILEVLQDHDLARRLTERGGSRVEDFEASKIIDHYEQCITAHVGN